MWLLNGFLDTLDFFGNEQADLLANTGSAEELHGPEPALPISTLIIKQGINEWVNASEELYSRNIKYFNHTKCFIRELNIKFERSMLEVFLLWLPVMVPSKSISNNQSSQKKQIVKMWTRLRHSITLHYIMSLLQRGKQGDLLGFPPIFLKIDD